MNATSDTQSMEVYDAKRRRWRAGPPFKGPRRNHTTGVAAGGYFYVLAGREGTRNYTVAERYDPKRRRWQRLPPMRRARGGIASAAVSRGRVVVFGGEDFDTGKTIPEVELTTRNAAAGARCRPCARHAMGWAAYRWATASTRSSAAPRRGSPLTRAIEFLDVR